MIRIGTSGWVYKHWRESFYPKELPQKNWFEFYARQYDTVEINNSIYRLPSAAAFEAWRAQAPPRFLYAVKASRYLTHMKKLQDPEEPLETFFERARLLKPRLGPVLYQLPPHWRLNLERFEHFLLALPRGYTHVVEFREPSWFDERVFDLLERYGVAHCIHDMRPLQVPRRVTAQLAYVRFHGAAESDGNYSDAALAAWARQIEEWLSRRLDVYVYFNNDWFSYALSNANTLKHMLGVKEYIL